jgi:Uma2 family endonuclease
MAARTRERATYEDLLKVPDHLVAELVDGDLNTSPRPGGIHARFASAIGMDVGSAYDRGRGGPGGWWILDEPELHLGGSVLVPDLAGWRRERMPVIPKDHVFAIPPDWVCEVLSPSTRQFDVRRKLPVYAAHEVTNAWLVDPEARTLEVFRLENSRWSMVAVFGGNEIARAEPFDAIDIDLPSIWGAEPEPDSVNDR